MLSCALSIQGPAPPHILHILALVPDVSINIAIKNIFLNIFSFTFTKCISAIQTLLVLSVSSCSSNNIKRKERRRAEGKRKRRRKKGKGDLGRREDIPASRNLHCPLKNDFVIPESPPWSKQILSSISENWLWISFPSLRLSSFH